MPPVFTVGRLEIDHVELPEWSGDQLTITGQLQADSLAELVAKRQAALGLVDEDEVVVPYAYTEDPSVDGFCSVTSVNIDAGPASLSAFWLDISLTLVRIRPYSSPVIESRLRGFLRSNSHSITTSTFRTWHAIPSAYAGYFPGDVNGASQTRETETGNVQVWEGGTGSSRSRFLDATQGWHVAPADYYNGAAVVRIAGVAQVGCQIENDVTGWSIDNGIIRVKPDASGSSVTLELWDPDANAYTSPQQFNIGVTGGSSIIEFGPAHTITIERNRPEMVVARVTYAIFAGISTETAATLDLVLRRGANYVEGVWQSDHSGQWGIEEDANVAAVALASGAGVKANATDANGNRYLIATPRANTAIVDGLELDAASTSFPFMLGYEIGSASPSGLDDDDATVAAYHGAVYERAAVVGR